MNFYQEDSWDPFPTQTYFLMDFELTCENLDQTSLYHIFNILTLWLSAFIIYTAHCITSAQSHRLSCHVQLCRHLCCKHGMGCRIIHKSSGVLVSALSVNPSFCTNTINTSVTAVLCWSGIEHYWFVFVPQCHEFYHIITNSSIFFYFCKGKICWQSFHWHCCCRDLVISALCVS